MSISLEAITPLLLKAGNGEVQVPPGREKECLEMAKQNYEKIKDGFVLSSLDDWSCDARFTLAALDHLCALKGVRVKSVEISNSYETETGIVQNLWGHWFRINFCPK